MFKRRQAISRVKVDGYAFAKIGIPRFDLSDPYHVAVTLSWPQFFLVFLCVYLAVNTLFATFYTIVPGAITNARPGNFIDAFFFSFETLATVGYGEMYPGGLYGHTVSAAEIICGLAFTAILTGLTFVRFSRPRAKFFFAEYPVVTQHNGQPVLMLRVANGRPGVMMDAKAKMNVLLSETTSEGNSFRAARELHLQRAQIPIFPLTWTIMHIIDEHSPLHGLDEAGIVAADARLFISLEARDPSLVTVVQDVHSYQPDGFRFGMHYADVISTEADGTPVADITRISEIEADALAPSNVTQGWSEKEEAWTKDAAE